MFGRLKRFLGRIWVRLLIVNLVVVLVPVAGMEFARIYERTLLGALERDMRNQARVTARMVEQSLREGDAIDHPRHAAILSRAAQDTRTRIRILGLEGQVVADSHANGPPEGPEPEVPQFSLYSEDRSPRSWPSEVWPEIEDRKEVRDALAGHPSAYTRVRDRAPQVFLFLTEPIRHQGHVVGVVYAVRSTNPVLLELYRVRTGLYSILGVTIAFTLLVSIVLAVSISRPLTRLSRVAKRIADGEPGVRPQIEGMGEIRELGDSLATMTDRLERRLRYIADFAADVAHEFKSPLTSIRGAAELLEEGADDDPDTRARFLRNIELDTNRLDRLVSRLLELSRIEASNEAKVVLDAESTLKRVAASISTDRNPIELNYAAPSRMISARPTDLETALRNIIDNALRFSPPDAPIVVTVTRIDKHIEFAVRDHGPGIADANLDRVFERFFTTDSERNGTGLGLSIVRTVALAHGGSVRAENASDGGAIIRMRVLIDL